MARITTEPVNVRAFLDMIALSEIGAPLLALSDDGYNVIVGSTADNPDLFADYSTHPAKLVQLTPTLVSTAAGRYQLLARYFNAYKQQLGLPDFSPISQDEIALQQIKECRAYTMVFMGKFDAAVALVAHIWASLPGSSYGQHTNDLDDLRVAYVNAGGVVA